MRQCTRTESSLLPPLSHPPGRTVAARHAGGGARTADQWANRPMGALLPPPPARAATCGFTLPLEPRAPVARQLPYRTDDFWLISALRRSVVSAHSVRDRPFKKKKEKVCSER